MMTLKLGGTAWSRPVARCSIGILSVLILYAVGSSFAQQPPASCSSLELATLPLPDAVLNKELPNTPSSEIANDPLFQEIQRMILQGGNPLHSKSSALELPTGSDANFEFVSEARWHGVESILTAARMLEKDVVECIHRNDVEQAAKTQLAIKNLRKQAVALLPGK